MKSSSHNLTVKSQHYVTHWALVKSGFKLIGALANTSTSASMPCLGCLGHAMHLSDSGSTDDGVYGSQGMNKNKLMKSFLSKVMVWGNANILCQISWYVIYQAMSQSECRWFPLGNFCLFVCLFKNENRNKNGYVSRVLWHSELRGSYHKPGDTGSSPTVSVFQSFSSHSFPVYLLCPIWMKANAPKYKA